MNKKQEAVMELECAKESAEGHIGNQAVDVVYRHGLDSYCGSDLDDIMCVRDDLTALIKRIEEVQKCRNMKALKKLLEKHYTKLAVKDMI